jgi:hypothetical protein
MKVIRVRDDEGQRELPYATKFGILKTVFPDMTDEQDYNGVSFQAITSGGWRSSLNGISISNRGHGQTIHRRVMITKNDEIDEVKLREKYEECHLLYLEEETAWKERSEKNEIDRKAFNAILTELGINDEWGGEIRRVYPYGSATIEGKVNAQKLKSLSEYLGHEIEVNIELRVPYEQAAQVYRIIYPEKKEVKQ